jgi:hypothetical protein
MDTTLTTAIVSASLFAGVMLGMWIRRLLPEDHLSADSREAVKLAMGLVGTMAALLLGLLVSSAKADYDTARAGVMQMAAKVAFLDRALTLYGPQAAEAHAQFRAEVEDTIRRMWPEEGSMPVQLAPDIQAGDAVYGAIQRLVPRDDTQHRIKDQAETLAIDLGQMKTLLFAQSLPSISKPLLIVVVSWLVVIFLSFSLLAPSNATATLALLASVISVSGAVFLILELDQPFGSLIQIPSEPMRFALSGIAK